MNARIVAPLVILGLSACDRGRQEAPLTTAPAASVGSALPAALQSPHYGAMDSHLDRGGQLYGYMDVDGDLAGLYDFGQKFYEGIAKSQPGQVPPDLDIKGMLSELGLHGVTAAGMSSVKLGAGSYRNKTYFHTPNGRQGLLKLMGTEAKEFQALGMAPEKSDLVFEQEFDLSALMEIVLGIGKRLPEPIQQPMMDGLKQPLPIPGLGLTVADILQKSKGRLLVCAGIVEGEKMPIPDPKVEIPAIDAVIALQGMGWLFEELRKQIPPPDQGGPPVEDTADSVKITVPVPPGQLGIYAPLAYFDKKADMLYFASRPAYLDSFRGAAGPKLTADPDYKAIAAGLPTKGNSLSYVSARAMDTYVSLITKAVETQMAQQGGPPEAKELMTKMMNLFMPQGKAATAAVTTCEANGIFAVANTPQSGKVAMVAMAITPLAVVATVATPMIGKARMRAREMQQQPAVLPEPAR